MYEAYVRTALYNKNLHVPQKPQPTVSVLAFDECKRHRKNLVVPLHRKCSKYLSIVLPRQEYVIHAQDRTTNARMH